MRVVFVGAGNLATRLSLEMRKSGMSIGQVYSHTSEHAKILADELGCGWTVVPEDIVEDADLYVFSLKDAVLQDVIARVKPNNGLWVHTAGSMPISVFEGLTARYGVVYPLQTFSKSREVDFKKIPFFLEANSSEDEKVLGEVALCEGKMYSPLWLDKAVSYRQEQRVAVELEGLPAGTVHLYCFFVSADGTAYSPGSYLCIHLKSDV